MQRLMGLGLAAPLAPGLHVIPVVLGLVPGPAAYPQELQVAMK